MRQNRDKQHIGNLAALLLFALFAACILSVLLTGAGTYRRIAQRDEQAYTHRTAAQYISNRVRQAESPSSLTAEDFCGIPSLTLRQDLGGITLLTRVYCHEGWLCELYYLDGSPLTPADGEKILPLEELSVLSETETLQVTLTHADGTRQQVFLSRPYREEGTP